MVVNYASPIHKIMEVEKDLNIVVLVIHITVRYTLKYVNHVVWNN